MGYDAALLIDTEAAGVVELLAAKNHLPAFWLGLLDAQALDGPQQHWQYQAQLVDDEELYRFTDIQPALTNQYVGLAQVHRNSARTARLLAQYHPRALPLFEEFSGYLLAQLSGPDDGLQFDLIGLGGDPGIMEYLARLQRQVAAFEAGAPLPWPLPPEPALLTGLPLLATTPVADAATYPLLSAAWTQPPAAALARFGGWWRRLWGGR